MTDTTTLPPENVRPMPLSEWDRCVSPHLRSIEVAAATVARHARRLPCRPSFQSLAETELAEARQVLTEALAEIVKAQAEYQRKPVDA